MRSNVEWYMLGGGLIGFAMLIVLGIFFITVEDFTIFFSKAKATVKVLKIDPSS